MVQLIGLEILVVDSDPTVIAGLGELLGKGGFVVSSTDQVDRARALLSEKFFAVVLCDLDTPAPGSGLEVVRAARELSPATSAIVLTSRRAYDAAVTAFRAGADDVIAKSPDQIQYLVDRVERAAMEHREDQNRTDLLRRVMDLNEEFLKNMMELSRQKLDLEDQRTGRSDDNGTRLGLCRLLLVDPTSQTAQFLAPKMTSEQGWGLTSCQTGGEALDQIGRNDYHLIMVQTDLPDLPGSMVTRTVKEQTPDAIVLEYVPPSAGQGSLAVVEESDRIPVLEGFTKGQELLDALSTLKKAYQAKLDERRYLQAFRAQHFDFLKQYAETRKQIQRVLDKEEQETGS
ncbi:MAG: response regulator [Deltaproteobacteria bacterium]|nr:response regulator [Deltaproteobacteria bacterium]